MQVEYLNRRGEREHQWTDWEINKTKRQGEEKSYSENNWEKFAVFEESMSNGKKIAIRPHRKRISSGDA